MVETKWLSGVPRLLRPPRPGPCLNFGLQLTLSQPGQQIMPTIVLWALSASNSPWRSCFQCGFYNVQKHKFCIGFVYKKNRKLPSKVGIFEKLQKLYLSTAGRPKTSPNLVFSLMKIHSSLGNLYTSTLCVIPVRYTMC